jgi:hypothetical protein
MINKIKNFLKENRDYQKKQIMLLKELDWANTYHDSIRGKAWLEKLPLNIGRWAGNYSFFYVLNRILNDYKPKSILEFGLGESTKFITSYLENHLLDSKHLVVEHDANWKQTYLSQNLISTRSNINICEIEEKAIKGYKSKGYKTIETIIDRKYDLYIIDGPFGSNRYSRYDIVKIAETFTANDEFIIILDDYNRKGEQDTAADLLEFLANKNIKTHTAVFDGNKNLLVIATEKYKYITSI